MRKLFSLLLLAAALPCLGNITIPPGSGGGASVSDTAYDATSWNGVTDTAPSKNAVRDKIETLSSGGSATVFYPETYGAVGDGTTVDNTGLDNCYTAAKAVHGTIHLAAKTYKRTTAWVIDDSVTIEGEGMFPQNGPISSIQSINTPIVSPYLKGSVILQATAATDAIQITGAGVGVNLRNFGIRFADAIKFSNTGHGVFCEGPAYAGKKDSGVMSSMWENIGVFGHDGNHYAFHFTNPICSTFVHLTGWGGGGIRIESNTTQSYYGNCVFEHPYFAVMDSGSAHGYHIKTPSGVNRLNFLTFIRPQVNVADTGLGTAPTNAQNTFKMDATGTGTNRNITIVAPDFETDCGAVTSGVLDALVNVTPGFIDGAEDHPGRFPSFSVDALDTDALTIGDPAAAPGKINGVVDFRQYATHGSIWEGYYSGTRKFYAMFYDGLTYFGSTGGVDFRDELTNAAQGKIASDGWTPISLADTDAANGTMYYSTTGSKLVFKDSGGTVHPLY